MNDRVSGIELLAKQTVNPTLEDCPTDQGTDGCTTVTISDTVNLYVGTCSEDASVYCTIDGDCTGTCDKLIEATQERVITLQWDWGGAGLGTDRIVFPVRNLEFFPFP